MRNKKNQENNLLKSVIKLYNLKNKIELEQNNKKYFSDINEIKKDMKKKSKKLKENMNI